MTKPYSDLEASMALDLARSYGKMIAKYCYNACVPGLHVYFLTNEKLPEQCEKSAEWRVLKKLWDWYSGESSEHSAAFPLGGPRFYMLMDLQRTVEYLAFVMCGRPQRHC